MTDIQQSNRWAPLTRELDNPRSPLRAFLDDRMTPGLKSVQARYRTDAPATLLVPSGTANAGTIGTAADWLLRFLIHPTPSLYIPLRGAGILSATTAGPLDPNMTVLSAFYALAEDLGVPKPTLSADVTTFTYPAAGGSVEPDLLARACWALALLTEAYRGGPLVALAGPLGRYQGVTLSRDGLLSLASDDALDQLAGLRRVFEDALIPVLSKRGGTWTLGPTFSGSKLIKGDADLIAAGLLVEVKTTSKKPTLAKLDLYQVIGYALMDLDDAYHLDAVALFSARYGYLAIWNLEELLTELSGRKVDVAALRGEFRDLLLSRLNGPGA